MRLRKIILATILFSVSSQLAFTQEILYLPINRVEYPMPLVDVLKDYQHRNGVRFYYKPAWFNDIVVERELSGITLHRVLDSLLQGTDISYMLMDNANIVFVKDPTQMLERQEVLTRAYKELKTVIELKLGEKSKGPKNKTIVIRGAVVDKLNKSPLEGVTISLEGTTKGTVTNKFGRFEISLRTGFSVLSLRSLNYDEVLVDLQAYSNGFVLFEMEEAATLLEEVVITNRIADDIGSTVMGKTEIRLKQVKDNPALLGQPDLIKGIQSYTGVSTVGEAAAGYNVRGGSVDQNLVLYDGVPVLNTSHAFGFFSSFNPDAIREATFLKSSLGAQYGGRASSVLDIKSSDGNKQKWGFIAGFGPMSSNFKLDGPLKKDKTSIMISSRFAYADWLLNSLRTNYVDLKNTQLNFSDWAVTVGHKINNDTKLTFSGYTSHDSFRFRYDTTYSNQTSLASVRLDKQFNPKLGSAFTLGVGDYRYSMNSTDLHYQLSYGILYPTLNASFYYQGGKHQLEWGLASTLYISNPGKFEPTDQGRGTSLALEKQRSLEAAVYIQDEIRISEKISAVVGLRLPYFNSLGPATVNVYADNMPRNRFTEIDTLHFGKNETVKQYFVAEPRLSFRYLLRPDISIKASYNRVNQFLNLITNTAAVSPFDIWQPANTYFRPQQADQFSLGIFRNLGRGVNVSFETYYKSMQNVLGFKNGAQLILNPSLETELLQGKSTAYGVEMSLVKDEGRLTGFFNYSYSRSFLQFNGNTASERVNGGNPFPANFDQPHRMNILGKYAFSRRYSLSWNFTYRTGRPITVPYSYYEVESHAIANFTLRNQYRMPDYMRFDVSFLREGNHKRRKAIDGTWVFSIYNLFGRQNAYSVFYKENSSGHLQAYVLSVVGSAIPSITYIIKI